MSHSEDKYLPPVVVRAIDNISRIKWSSYPIKIPELQVAVYLLLKKRTMGYYTSWNTDVSLSRKLTREEFVIFSKWIENFTSWWHIEELWLVDKLCVYEDSFKSYDLEVELTKVISILKDMWIKLNGTMKWDWEESGDEWTIYLIDSISNSVKNWDPLTIVDFLEKNWFPEAAKAARIFVAQNF